MIDKVQSTIIDEAIAKYHLACKAYNEARVEVTEFEMEQTSLYKRLSELEKLIKDKRSTLTDLGYKRNDLGSKLLESVDKP